MISLKKADFSDIEFLWHLRNQPDVDQYSKGKRKIAWSEHINWIMPIILGTVPKPLFIIKKGSMPVGQIRFDFNNNGEYIVSISVLREFRGKGVASKSFKKAIKLLKKSKRPKVILAEIHKDNISSQKFFEKLNFKLKDPKGSRRGGTSGTKKRGKWLGYILKI